MEELSGVSNAPRQIHKCAWRTPNLCEIYLFLVNLLCMRKALPAAICLASWISWRAPWASTRASFVLSSALVSLEACSELFCSKDSHLVMASLSSCSTSPTRASCLWRVVCVGERCRKLKKFLWFHQDPSMSSSKQRVKGVSLHLHTTCRSSAEAFKGMVMMESYSP